MRDYAPVYYCERRDVWALSRFDDVQAAARDWQTFSSATPRGASLEVPASVARAGNLIAMDPPEHDALRNLIRRRFAPKSVKAEFQAVIETALNTVLADMPADREVDLARDFAWRLPVAVIRHLLRVPPEDERLFQEWVRAFSRRERGRPELPQRAIIAAEAMRTYFSALMESDSLATDSLPGDLLTDIPQRGPAFAPDVLILMLTAGTETTVSLLGNALHLLDRYPDARRALVKGSVSFADAIEEVLRFESPIQHLTRVTTREVTVRDTTIPKGAHVALLWAAANRDERRFANAEQFMIERPHERNVAFGVGIHHCLGAPIARLEAAVALPRFLARFPNYVVSSGARRMSNPLVRGFDSLPAVLAPAW